MQTKTYFASSVPAALEVARKELGPEAMLVNSRPAPSEARAFGRLEVTFAFDPTPAPASLPEKRIAPTPASHPRSELDDIRQQLAALREVVGQQPARPPAGPAFDDYLNAAGSTLNETIDRNAPLISRLCANGLDSQTASEITAAAALVQGDSHTALVRELARRIPFKPFGEMKPGERRTLAFVGPAGRGKTTTLVKVAVAYGLAKQVPVRIYSAGAHAIGGQEQMARYATILGVPFQASESLETLHLTLNGDAWNGLVLIDTPGVSRAESADLSALSTFFSRRPEIEKHLVLRADSRTADMVHMVSSFKSLAPSRLLFTGLDEALTLGAMAEVLIRTGIPTSFEGAGQQIPEDIGDANPEKWASLICSGEPRAGNLRAAAAA